MSNFSPELENATEKQLNHWINESDSRYASLAQSELIRRTYGKVEKTIDNFKQESSKQTKKMITLTWCILVLTIVLVFLALC